jgi:hypothetical protein
MMIVKAENREYEIKLYYADAIKVRGNDDIFGIRLNVMVYDYMLDKPMKWDDLSKSIKDTLAQEVEKRVSAVLV